MARPVSMVFSLFCFAIACLLCCGPAAQGDEKKEQIASLEKELGEVRRQILGTEGKIKMLLEPNESMLKLMIEKLERDIGYFESELSNPANKDKAETEKSLAHNREALVHFKGIRAARELGKNQVVGEIGKILEATTNVSPYAARYVEPFRKELAKLQEQEQQLAQALVLLTGKPLPTPAVAGTEQLFKPNKDDYAAFLTGVGWTADGERGVLRLLPNTGDDPITKEIMKLLGFDKAMSFNAVKRGPEYVIEGQDYLELVKKAATLVSDSSTTLVFESARMTITPIDEDMILAIHLTGTITTTVDGQPKTTKLGLDDQGNSKPIKFLLKPDKPAPGK